LRPPPLDATDPLDLSHAATCPLSHLGNTLGLLLLLGYVNSVGKTSLMNQYVNKRFSNQYKATIGA
jgi:hypothetical protein